MLEKPLILLSILFSSLGLGSVADNYDRALARLEAGNVSKVVASNDVIEIGFPEITPTPRIKAFSERPEIAARHALLGDLDSGKILYKQDISSRVPIASTTKIMTAVVALENYKLSEIVTVSEAAAAQIGADAFLRTGEEISVEQLLYCLLIKSGNDAAYALAAHLNDGKDVQSFVGLMNQKARELGLKNTEYHDPAGLDISGYSSAEDLFLVSRYALKNPTFRQITSTSKYTATNIDGTVAHPLDNSNRLVGEFNYLGAIGVKTGYMPEAGHCLVSAVEREGRILIGVVLNTLSDTAAASAIESRRLQDWGWSNLEWK